MDVIRLLVYVIQSLSPCAKANRGTMIDGGTPVMQSEPCPDPFWALSAERSIPLNSTTYAIKKDIEQYWFQYGPLRDITCYWSPFWHWAIDCNSSNAAIQPIPYPSSSLPIKPYLYNLGWEVVWDNVKGLTDVKMVTSVALPLSVNTATPL